jgi:dGTPase
LAVVQNEAAIFRETYGEVEAAHHEGRGKLKFNEALKRVLDRLATDLIENTQKRIAQAGVKTIEDVRAAPERLAGFGAEMRQANAELKRFLYTRLYDHPAIVEDRERSVACLEELFRYYLERPKKMPPYYYEQSQTAPRHVVVCDYIAGMTDHFLLRQHRELIGGLSSASQSA